MGLGGQKVRRSWWGLPAMAEEVPLLEEKKKRKDNGKMGF